jgi:precorrin-6B methylase 2
VLIIPFWFKISGSYGIIAANNMDRAANFSAEAGRSFINSLYETVMGAGEYSLKALEELSNIALGGHGQARELIGKIDEATATGKLVLPQNKEAHE